MGFLRRLRNLWSFLHTGALYDFTVQQPWTLYIIIVGLLMNQERAWYDGNYLLKSYMFLYHRIGESVNILLLSEHIVRTVTYGLFLVGSLRSVCMWLRIPRRHNSILLLCERWYTLFHTDDANAQCIAFHLPPMKTNKCFRKKKGLPYVTSSINDCKTVLFDNINEAPGVTYGN